MPEPVVEITLAGERVGLLHEGALWWPARQMLLVADAHIGKAVSFRRLGVPVPQGTTTETLDALSAAVERTAAQHIVFLGDLLHSARSHAPDTLAACSRWRERHAALQLTLVRGNHDDRAGDPPGHLGVDVVDGPLQVGPFALCHHPEPVTGAYALAGHWHPCVTIGGRARERLRLPCFWLGDEASCPVGVLPAFGAFTGMHPIERRAGDRVYAVAGEVVREVP